MATPTSPQYVDFDEYIEYQLQKTRSQIRWTDLLTAIAGIAVLTVGYLFVFTLLDHWVIPDGFSVRTRGWMLGILVLVQTVWIAWKVVWPSWRQVNSLFAARTLESAEPGFKNTLLTLLDLRGQQRSVPVEIQRSIEKRAALRLSEMDVEQSIDRRMLLRLSYALLALVVLCCAYTVMSPKKLSFLRPLSTVATAVPSRTHIVAVRPGSTELLAGSQLAVEVDLEGEIPERVVAFFTTRDRRFVDEPVELHSIGEALMEYGGVIGGATGGGIQQDLSYYVVAGDSRSETYEVTVLQSPTVAVEEVLITFPDYMAFSPRTQTGADIDAWDGAMISWKARANQPVAAARVRFFASPNDVRPMNEIGLRVTDGVQLDGKWKAAYLDGKYPTHYAIECTTENGDVTRNPARYSIEIHPDQPPEVFLDPAGEIVRPANAVIPLAIRAHDPDFTLRSVELRVNRGDETLLKQRLFDAFTDGARQTWPLAQHELSLAELQAAPGDRLTVWVEARDNKPELGQAGRSHELQILIEAPVSQDRQQRDLEQQRDLQNERLEDQGLKPDAPNDAPAPADQEPEDSPTESEAPSDQNNPTEAESDAGEGSGESASPSGQSGETQGGESGNARPNTEGAESETREGQSDSGGEQPGPADDAEALRRLIEQQLDEQEPTESGTGEGGQQPPADGSRNEPPGSQDSGSNDSTTQGNDSSESGNSTDSTPTPPDAPADAPQPSPSESQSGGSNPDPTAKNQPSAQPADGANPDGSTEPPGSPDTADPSAPAGEQPAAPNPPQQPSAQQPDAPTADEQQPGSDMPPPPTGDPGEQAAPGGDEQTPASGSASQPGTAPNGQRQPGETSQNADRATNPTAGENLTGQKQTVDPDESANPERPADGTETGPARAADPNTKDPARAQNPDQLEKTDPKSTRRPGSPDDADNARPGQQNERPQTPPSGTRPGDSPNDTQSPPETVPSQPGQTQKADPKSDTPGAQPPADSSTSRPGEEGTPANQSGDMPTEDGTAPSGENQGGAETDRDGQESGSGSGKPSGGGDKPGTEAKPGSPAEQSSGKGESTKPGETEAGDRGEGKSGKEGTSPDNSGAGEAGGESKSSEGQASSSQSGPGGGGDGKSAMGASRRSASGDVSENEPTGGTGAGESTSPVDDPNLEYTRKAANLVLQRLKDQLKRGEVDPEMLRELGWTEDDVRRFTQRLEQQLQAGPDTDSLDNEIRRRQFEETLKSYELKAPGARQADTYQNKRSGGGVSDRRLPVPSRYRERFEAFTRSVSGSDQAGSKPENR